MNNTARTAIITVSLALGCLAYILLGMLYYSLQEENEAVSNRLVLTAKKNQQMAGQLRDMRQKLSRQTEELATNQKAKTVLAGLVAELNRDADRRCLSLHELCRSFEEEIKSLRSDQSKWQSDLAALNSLALRFNSQSAALANAESELKALAVRLEEETAKRGRSEAKAKRLQEDKDRFEAEAAAAAEKAKRFEADLLSTGAEKEKLEVKIESQKEDLALLVAKIGRLITGQKSDRVKLDWAGKIARDALDALAAARPKKLAEIRFPTGQSALGENDREKAISAAALAVRKGGLSHFEAVGSVDRQPFPGDNCRRNSGLAAERSFALAAVVMPAAGEIPVRLHARSLYDAPPESLDNPAARKAELYAWPAATFDPETAFQNILEAIK